MTKIGEAYTGVWPEHPVESPQAGDVVRYPEAGTAIIRQATIQVATDHTVLFDNGDWCHIWEISENRD